jgi:hypothetical protein
MCLHVRVAARCCWLLPARMHVSRDTPATLQPTDVCSYALWPLLVWFTSLLQGGKMVCTIASSLHVWLCPAATTGTHTPTPCGQWHSKQTQPKQMLLE